MADFATLKTRVQNRLIDSNAVVTGEVGSWINKAIREIEDLHNFRAMRATLSATTTNVTRKLVDLPSDWKEPRDQPILRIGEGGTVDTKQIDWAPSKNWLLTEGYQLDDTADSGEPRFLLLEQVGAGDEDIWVFPFPDQQSQWTDGNWRLEIPYYRYLTDLSLGTDTNWFTDNAEDYLLMRATAEGFSVNWDEARATYWRGLAENERAQVIRLDKRNALRRNRTLVPHLGAARHATR